MFKTPLLESDQGVMLTPEDGDQPAVTEETALLITSAIKHDEHKTRNQGGLSKKMPHRGYCLVFNKGDIEKDKYTLFQNQNTLMMKYIDKKEDREKEKNLLPNLIECNIKYYIHQTKQYYFVIISMDDDIIEEWADNIDYEIEIEPVNAIRIGREISNEFDLAQNTYVESLDGKDGM